MIRKWPYRIHLRLQEVPFVSDTVSGPGFWEGSKRGGAPLEHALDKHDRSQGKDMENVRFHML